MSKLNAHDELQLANVEMLFFSPSQIEVTEEHGDRIITNLNKIDCQGNAVDEARIRIAVKAINEITI
jgi:hypothetical protein